MGAAGGAPDGGPGPSSPSEGTPRDPGASGRIEPAGSDGDEG